MHTFSLDGKYCSRVVPVMYCTSTEVEILKVLDNHSLFNPSQSDNMKVLFYPFLPPISERSLHHLNVHRLCPLVLMTITLRCRLVQSDGGMDRPATELRPHPWEAGGKLHDPWHGHIWEIKNRRHISTEITKRVGQSYSENYKKRMNTAYKVATAM